MGILQAIGGAVGGTFGDQWKDEGVITNGSKIYVPENMAAFIFSQSGIENIISQPGGYEYHDGQESIFNGDAVKKSIFKQIGERIGYGGITSDYKQIAFVNLREIRDIKFGTRGPLMYNDLFYGTDLEIFAYGSFSILIGDPVRFSRNFVPANVTYYSFDDQRARSQILAEFLQSFTVALNALSTQYRISQLPAQANDIAVKVANDRQNAGTWPARFGFNIVKIGIENIEFSDASRELVRKFSANKMDLKAYEDVSQHASIVAAEQKIALQEGVYAQMQGPSYETPAEVKMAGILGADAVGMSTAVEAIAAVHFGMRVCGISCVCNPAAGISKVPLSHKEVQEAANEAAPKFKKLVTESVIRFGEV